ncbi:type II toxin-antitoxin system RelE/ParE family toxin [Neisseria gonorrhoeae]|uniref:type II toxin-antitoxin system RelE/ParE family toxin n=1 Tax=Neisseria gonorrhoeae TaxID=485 RepID=UPI0021618957|nr:type II toxin-antitoxin system RelE/ParE family toxin [Neisseria gonorrhoeae]
MFETAEKIGQMPYMGRKGRVAGTREFVAHPNYILVYQVKLDEIRILRVLHGSRKYP